MIVSSVPVIRLFLHALFPKYGTLSAKLNLLLLGQIPVIVSNLILAEIGVGLQQAT